MRFVANGDPDPEIFERLTNSNQIGARVSLSNDKQTNKNRATFLD
ncbi:MAG: hypothetical protein ACI8XZ_001675 [Gammaproteobacteria bacterium]